MRPQGTILLVSHDRYLIDALGTQIWEIEPDQTSLRVFQGSYSEYHTQKEAEKEAGDIPTHKIEFKGRPRAQRPTTEERRRRARLSEVESRIAKLEEQLGEVSKRLENPPAEPGEVQRLGESYVEIQNEINALLFEWEGLQEMEKL